MWSFLKPWFVPAPPADDRPQANDAAGRYIRSFLFFRLTIGTLGLLLPPALVVVDKLAFHGDPFPRDSMSVYYYSGMREVFTVTLGTIAFFLFAYKITERNLDNTLSVIAGLAGLLIPLFPTGRPHSLRPFPPLTPLQKLIGEDWTRLVHYGASAVFIAALGGVCVLFGRREAKRDPHGNARSAEFWKWWHLGCAGAIALAGAWILATTTFGSIGPLIHGPLWSLLLGEWVATWAFAFSWFMKGAEIKYLFGLGAARAVP